MNDRHRLQMVFHGIMVIVLGLLAGIPYALVVTGQMAGETRAWSMAHGEGIQNGLLTLVVAAVGSLLALSEKQSRLCAWSFIAAAYGNVVASILGASTGNRGLELALPIANVMVFALFTVAIVGVFTGLWMTAKGASAALRSR